MRGNSFRSAPPEKLPGLPVMTSAEKSPCSSSGRRRASDSSAPRPKTFGRPGRVPSSIVTSATESTRSSVELGHGLAHGRRLSSGAVTDWDEHVEREAARYADGEARLPPTIPTRGSGS